jgi:hypothetical protein
MLLFSLAIAHRAACLLGLDTKNSYAPVPRLDGLSDGSHDWLSAEMARRCFWAIWVTSCINSDNQLSDVMFSDRVMDLPLPISESSFLRGRQEHPLRSLSSMQQTGCTTNAPDTHSLAKPSILGELMGILLYWSVLHPDISS